MKDEKKRTLYLKVRVSPEEMAAIKKKFENSGMKLSITLDTLTARILKLSSDS